MSINISVYTQEILNASNTIKNNAAELETAVNNVSTIISNVKEGWVGANANEFSDRIQNFKNTKLASAVNALNSTATALKVSGETTAATQENIKMKIANLGMISTSVSGAASGNFVSESSLNKSAFTDPNLKFVERENGVVDIIRKDDITGEDVIIGRTTEDNLIVDEKNMPITNGEQQVSLGNDMGNNLTDRGFPSSTGESTATSENVSNLTDEGYPSSTSTSSQNSTTSVNNVDHGGSGYSRIPSDGTTITAVDAGVNVMNSDMSFSEAVEGRLDIDVSNVDSIKRDGWGAINDFNVKHIDTLKYNADTNRYVGYSNGTAVSSYSLDDISNAWVD